MDPSQIDQILVNLCVNARDAITGIGKVTIETSAVTFDEAYCSGHTEFIPGDFVLLSVSDDGCGMDRQTLEKLFEPFFTTKGVGKGTGLGLATVYGIVRQNNGLIHVYSEPGKGTTFRIYLPRYMGKVDQASREAVISTPSGHGETVLIVEDEPALLDLGRTMLEKLGYIVLTADTSSEAVRLAKTHASEIHLLITDVVMPEMNGRELAEQVLTLHPNMKTLFMSGYTANIIADHGVLDEDAYFIPKPFSSKDIAIRVHQALSRGLESVCKLVLGPQETGSLAERRPFMERFSPIPRVPRGQYRVLFEFAYTGWATDSNFGSKAIHSSHRQYLAILAVAARHRRRRLVVLLTRKASNGATITSLSLR